MKVHAAGGKVERLHRRQRQSGPLDQPYELPILEAKAQSIFMARLVHNTHS